MALMPVAEILLRALLRVGISGAASFTQHFALIAGMLGAAVAAREQRLLSLSTLDSLLVGRGALLARFFTRTVAVIVGALLCLASVELVLAERAGGNVIAYGIPVWLGQAALPLGFALITLRLAWSAGVGWPARLASLALAAAVAAAAASRRPLGNAMAITAVCAGLRGGAAIVTVLACAFFTSFSGASGVTIIALGGMLMPLLLSAGYSQKNALGLLAGAGSLGGMLPPGLPLVLYAIVARVSIEEMFLAGILPGLLLVALVALWGFSRAPRAAVTARKFDWREARAALLAAKWELALPPVAFLGLFAGFATPVEAAALTAVYAFIVEVLVHRDLDLRRDVPRVMAECGLLVGGVLLILGVALGFTNYLVDARIPERAVDWVTGAIHSRWMFLVALNLFLLVAGCLLDIFSATVVLVPLIVPLGLAFGVDPIHLGIVFLVNMELGYLTPPVGMNLFFAAYRFGKPLPEVCRAALPVVGVLAIGVLLVTFVPWLATGLPQLLK